MHYLSIAPRKGGFDIHYYRYTLRYPLEFYDEGEEPPLALMHVEGGPAGEDDDSYFGPIMVYPRKSRFTRAEVEAIWRATNGHCHICDHAWKLADRGGQGWHIDHLIPHIGGGRDVEQLPNFRVACASCNLKKGKGYTQARIHAGLRRLIEAIVG